MGVHVMKVGKKPKKHLSGVVKSKADMSALKHLTEGGKGVDAASKTKALERVMLSVDVLEPQSNNPNEMSDRLFNLLVDNIQRMGVTDPVLVRPLGGGRYRIVGGEHRWRAAKVAGLTEVPATVVNDKEFDDDKEKFQVVRHNIIKGKISPKKFLALYESLSQKYTEEVAAESFGFADEEEFKKLIRTTAESLPEELKEQFKEAAKEVKTLDDLAKLLNHLFCHDEATEFLSEGGWLPHIAYKSGMKIATFDPATNRIIWDDQVSLHTFDVENKVLYQFQGKSTDVCVTGDHTMLVGSFDVWNKPVEWATKKASDFSEGRLGNGLHKWAFKTRNDPDELGVAVKDKEFSFGTITADDLIEFTGWFVTEGHFHSRGTALCITQKKSKTFLQIRQLCERLNKAGVPYWGPYVHKEVGKFYLVHAELKDWVQSFCGYGAANKKLPVEFLYLPLEQTRLLFLTMMAGDGHWAEDGFGSYASLSKTLADQVQMLAVRLGHKAYLAQRKSGIWSVSITSGVGYTTLLRENFSLALYTGKVWCFITKAGFFITRRNGKVAYHGNSTYGDTLPFGYMIFDFGGKDSVWLRMSKKSREAFDVLSHRCRDKKKALDHVMENLLGFAVSAGFKKELDEVFKMAKVVKLKEAAPVPTLDYLDEMMK